MQLPSTGPLKLAIRWQRNRLNLKMISQIQIRSVFDHRAAGFGSNSQHCEVQTCRRLIPPKCIFVRYLCGINYRTEFVDPQVRHCKNCSRAASRRRDPEASRRFCSETRTYSMPSSASSTFTVTLLRFHRRRWRVALLHSLKGVRFGLREEMLRLARTNSL